MSKDYKYTLEDLYAATDNGLAIIHRYIPASIGTERTKKPFKLRDERTASAYLFKTQSHWIVKDFGGVVLTPIEIFSKETGIENTREAFPEILERLCVEFNVTENNIYYEPNKTFSDKGNLPDDYFFIKVKKKITNSKYFSEFVTPEICERYNVYEVEYYEKVTSTKKVLMRVNATNRYPIFCYSNNLKKWAKIYCPAEKKRSITKEDGTKEEINFKHAYLGKKEGKYIHGLDFINKKLTKKKRDEIDGLLELLKNNKTSKSEMLEWQYRLEQLRLPYVIICSGGSDGLTVASLSNDYYPVWCNSEGEMIDVATYQYLKKYSNHLINLPDVDKSGIKYAYDYSKFFWQLDTVFLPKDLLGGGKDFRDYISFLRKQGKSKESILYMFNNLLKIPVSFKFVTEIDNKYKIDNANLHYFLNANNYYVHISDFVVADGNENIGSLVKLEGYKVLTPKSIDVRNFCIDFLRRNDPNRKKIELIYTCNALRDNDLKQVPSIDINFVKYGKDFQLFFFENICVKVTPEGAKTVSWNKNECFVKEETVIKKSCFLLKERFFEEYKDDNGQNRVRILKEDFDFMNFLINGSRVYWKEERLLNSDFRKKITLNSPVLTEQQQIVQEQHFLSKCFAFGYLLHRYCVVDFQKFVYVVDDEMQGGVDAANGGSGKGIFTKSLLELTKVHEMSGKNKTLFNDKHKYDGLDETHDIICFNDLTQTDFKNFYNDITDGITVDTKHKKKFYIPYNRSPKIVGTFNYGLRNADGSDLRRILFVTFSSYYHPKSEDFSEWQPRDDFGRRFFTEWTETDFNVFFNFAFRCVEFYMKNLENPMYAPMENIEKNNLRATIGDNFLEWADVYFEDDPFDAYVSKNDLYNQYKAIMPKSLITPNGFKKSMQNYCKLRGYVFNPEYVEGFQKDKMRITRFMDGKTQECFYFTKKTTENKTKTTVVDNKDDLLNDIHF